ncbi:SEP protein [Rhizoctonia solani]|uniref:SEP protein n=1 Tax=Rhizoctonia solani TaxID=456999 RepID=A0A8H7I9U9_9AGAM|nr:SEP protein [Rhizoctonia solani]
MGLATGRVPAAKEWMTIWLTLSVAGLARARECADREVRAEEMFVTAGSKGGCEGKWSWGDVIKSACLKQYRPSLANTQYEGYRPSPPKPATPFSRSGNRLGPSLRRERHPGPGLDRSSMPGVFANSEPEGIRTMFEVDNSQPTTSIQVRLADGTRLACRMNVTRTAVTSEAVSMRKSTRSLASVVSDWLISGWVGWLVGWIRSTLELHPTLHNRDDLS